MLNKSWKPSVEDIRREIERLRNTLTQLPFNSDFGHQIQKIKIREAEMTERLNHLISAQKAEAHRMREMVDAMMAECRREISETHTAVRDLRTLRAERSRANYLHIQELKQQDSDQIDQPTDEEREESEESEESEENK